MTSGTSSGPTGAALAPAVELTDAVLLAAIATGDLGSLGALYDRHARAVYRVVHRVTNGAGDVDDLVHATFLKVPDVASSFDGRPSARAWLIGIAVRLALRHRRTLGRFARMLGRFAQVTGDAYRVDPEVHAAGRARLAALDAAVARLSPAKRAVFVLIEMEGLSHEEVAAELSVPVPTVRTRLFHAKQELREALARTGDA
jgi:RNA polymerase sigma-70 factor (ECF subfamily)